MEQFTTWHDYVKGEEGITADGKVGMVRGVDAPDNQRTTAFSIAYPHPTNDNDYIWAYGCYEDAAFKSLNNEDALKKGWFPECEEC